MPNAAMHDFWARVRSRAEAALAAGAMHSFEPALERVGDAGVDFVVRRATRYPAGESAAGRTARAPGLPADPFLEPEPPLVVGAVGDTHIALLNKFSVLREHLLLVTRGFVDQRVLLDADDFGALAACAHEAGVLAFYNGGEVAGASQRHKHLQLVTLPLAPWAAVPMDAALRDGAAPLPFRHARVALEEGDLARPARLLAFYRDLLAASGVGVESREGREWQATPYSLVVTRRWMLLAPRARERFEGISVNSLAFAGSLFVRDERGLAILARAGPMAALREVGFAT